MNRLLLIFGILLMFSCAQQVAPTGGPEDVTPPKILEEIPANLSTNFSGKEIEIKFDEFIQLQSATEQVVISPPVLRQPNYQLKKKSLILKFEEELSPNTTYTINFGEAIRDNNEGNILTNYTYVFSTGAHLDSMQVKGKLIDVLTNEPEADALVMLYKSNIDSLPLDTIPDYFTRTDESGHFHIRNVADQPYKIFALKDENANYKFDVKTEKIGFLDSLVTPYTPPASVLPDTTRQDSLVTDSLNLATMKKESVPMPEYNMVMFVEEDTMQFLKKSYCDYFGKLVFVYNRPVSEFQLEMKDFSSKKQWKLKDISPTGDTVTVWVTDVVPEAMTLYSSIDNRPIDTVEITMKERADFIESGGKGKGAKRQQKKFALTASTRPSANRSPKPKEPLSLVWNHPVLGMDISRMKLYEDSIRVNYDITTQDQALRVFDIAYDWKPGSQYRLLILDSAFTDIYGLWNDTIETSFAGSDKNMFGSLSLKITETPAVPILVELLNSASKLIERKSVAKAQTITFNQLVPGNYDLLIIEDINGNGKWDTGDYAQKRQPEPMRSIKKGSEVRANWELELEWNPNSQE